MMFFLSNLSNKDRFVDLIGEKLEQVGCKVIFAKEDADLEIARISTNESLTKNVTLISGGGLLYKR